ncbi:hypothetical protein L873DRAFT_1815223 [Choiromyces venosus 120613-1]|uniref:Uncharacterized protein n=1 Tax=Choiromyces venosus 120613-1 TaxID=1336337 RepID=A0A3N4J6I4_9PEZI|nr:hypothetical protein L873DRAFT_1815223 [Choiromyces venosus 120613-1]
MIASWYTLTFIRFAPLPMPRKELSASNGELFLFSHQAVLLPLGLWDTIACLYLLSIILDRR